MRRGAATILLFAAACSQGAGGAKGGRPPPHVTTVRVEARDVPVEIRAPVDLRPIAQVEVGSKALGYLDAVLVERGDKVKKNQLLALVRPSDLPDQLAAARSALTQAQAATALARINKERAERLAPSGVVSQQELQNATTALATSEAQLASAQSQASALAVRLGETRIDSPLEGVVSARRLDPGALVGPTAGTGSIVTIDRIDTLRVFVPVNEREVGSLRVGQEARLDLDAYPGRPFPGRVVRIAPSFDPGTRTIDAEVQLANAAGELRAGMYGRAAIVTAVHPAAVVAPASAIQLSSNRAYVFVVREGKARRLEVQLGVDGGDWLEVRSGLAAGEELVTAGSDGLSDGSPVRTAPGVDPFKGPAAKPAAANP